MKRSLTSDAEDELTEVALWYEDRREGLGVEFLEEAERVFRRIEENPKLYQVVHLDIRRANIRRFPYSVYTSFTKTSSASWLYITILATLGDGSGGESERLDAPRASVQSRK